MTNTKSKEFRYIYAGTSQAQFNGSELVLKVGMRDNLNLPVGEFTEEAGIIFQPSAAKVMALSIIKILESYERVIGATIPVDDVQLQAVEKIIADAESKAINKTHVKTD